MRKLWFLVVLGAAALLAIPGESSARPMHGGFRGGGFHAGFRPGFRQGFRPGFRQGFNRGFFGPRFNRGFFGPRFGGFIAP